MEGADRRRFGRQFPPREDLATSEPSPVRYSFTTLLNCGVVGGDENAAHRLFGFSPLIRMSLIVWERESCPWRSSEQKDVPRPDPTGLPRRATVVRCRLTHARPQVMQNTEKWGRFWCALRRHTRKVLGTRLAARGVEKPFARAASR